MKSGDQKHPKDITQILLKHYTPPSLVVNSQLQILEVHGRVDQFVDTRDDALKGHLLKQARSGLAADLRSAFEQAQKTHKVSRRNVTRIEAGKHSRNITIEVRPLKSGARASQLFLVVFQEKKALAKGYLRTQPADRQEFKHSSSPSSQIQEAADITTSKLDAIRLRGYAEVLVESISDSVLVLDGDLKIIAANLAFYETFKTSAEETLGVRLQQAGNEEWDIPELIATLKESREGETELKNFEVEREFPGVGVRNLLLNAFSMKPGKTEPLTLLSIEDVTDYRRSIALLEEQSRMIDLSHDAIIVRAPNSAVVVWNKGAELLYGFTKAEALGRVTHELLATKFPEPFDEVQSKLMGEGGEWSGELIHTSRDGNQITVSSRQVIRRDAAGSPIAILEINRDVTQHKQAELALRTSEARLRALVSSMDDAVFEVNEEGLCLSAWTSNLQLLSHLKKDSPLRTVEDFLPIKSFPPLREACDRVLRTNKPETVEYPLELRGRRCWFLARINRINTPQGQPNSLSVLVRDVNAQKEAEIGLQQSEERFRLLVEGVKDYAIFALDTEGYVVSWNTGAERIKGYARQDIIGKHFSIFYAPEDVTSGQPRRNLDIAASEGRFEEVGAWRIRKDGSRFFANIVITAIRDQDGSLRGFTKISRDITDRKRAEEAIQQLSGHILRLQDEERRRIARDLHDSTAQVLTALSMNLSLLANRPGVAQDQHATRLIAESESLAQQASEEVRSTSHLLHPPDLDTVGLVAAIRWYTTRFSERMGITVRLSLPDDLCRLPPDNEIALFRVMQESLTNVQRHSGSKSVRVRIVQHGDQVEMEIEDRGHGIPDGVLGLDQRSVPRVGVGIAGMRERLKQLGGKLEITSSAKGTKLVAVISCPSHQPSLNALSEPPMMI